MTTTIFTTTLKTKVVEDGVIVCLLEMRYILFLKIRNYIYCNTV